MADDADLTTERAEKEAGALLLASRQPEGGGPTGRCHWCDEIVTDTHRYCDAGCRDDHAADLAHRKRNGLR